MRRVLERLRRRMAHRASARRTRNLRRAEAERQLGERHDGSIWRSGKGGSHYG